MKQAIVTVFRMFLHYILVLIVKVERLLRHQKIKIINKVSLETIKAVSGPIIFTPTHCGKFDIQVMTEVLWHHRWSLLSGDPHDLPGTVEGYWLKFNGVVYVDRDDKESRNKAKQEMIGLLQKGENIMLYPEGTWNFSPNQLVLPLFRGIADIAAAAKAVIVPFGLEVDDKTNTYYVVIGDPIVPTVEPLELLEELRDQMATLKWKLFEYLPGNRIDYDKALLDVSWNSYIKKRLSECRYMNYELIWKYARKEPWHIEVEQIKADLLKCHANIKLSHKEIKYGRKETDGVCFD
ncbi:MAG: hypothetical protein E7618_03900 [Ruminococcaceae bacterium]|nr:hypothetical protein [Oscillospiraceae bacterium]